MCQVQLVINRQLRPRPAPPGQLDGRAQCRAALGGCRILVVRDRGWGGGKMALPSSSAYYIFHTLPRPLPKNCRAKPKQIPILLDKAKAKPNTKHPLPAKQGVHFSKRAHEKNKGTYRNYGKAVALFSFLLFCFS